jgi:PBP1b-binding outer membrane lipoprotein LpoB
MSYTKSIALLLLIILVTVAGCSNSRRTERAELSQRAKTELVGLSKIELLTCAGVPVRSAAEGVLEFLSYGSSSYGWGGSCVVTFVLQDDAVKTISYSGRTGRRSQNGEQCAYAVANCLVTRDST